MTILNVLSAGAAKGFVSDLRASFAASNGATVEGVFDAVGAITERFVVGTPCDVLISTAAELQMLEAAGRLTAGSIKPIGAVAAALAVPTGQLLPDVSTAPAFAATMAAATAVYVPDLHKSTAGSHVRCVLATLGLLDTLGARLRPFPNGALAMHALASDRLAGAVGCTQATEIMYTDGLSLVGLMPAEYGLSTIYAAAVSTKAAEPAMAHRLVAALTGPASRDMRIRAGFQV